MTDERLKKAFEFADATIHMGAPKRIIEAGHEAAETLAAEVRRLQAIVDRLPKDASGRPVGPGDRVWVLLLNHPEEMSVWEFFAYDYPAQTRIWSVQTAVGEYRLLDCYPTREAAEAARKDA